jgi:hypothetical protein
MPTSRRKPRRRAEAPRTHTAARRNGNGSRPGENSILHLGFDLGEVSRRVEREPGPPERLPREQALLLWQRLLRENERAWLWLRGRGLSDQTITQARLGFHYGSRHAITIPLRDEGGRLYNLKRRYLDGIDTPERRKYKALRGHPHGLYPDMPEGRSVLLCEGEFDALMARQHGLHAVTGTLGVEGWKAEWSRRFRDRRVAVVFDAGPRCYEFACERAEELRAGGAAEAWPVELGLAPGEDISDWFAKYRRSATELRRLVRQARGRRDG